MPIHTGPERHGVTCENEAVIRSLFDRVYSTGELSLVDELVASDFTGDSSVSAEPYIGADGMKTHVSRLRAAFHGFTIEIDDLYLEDDTFEVQWTARGTHERRFMAIKPTCTIGQAGEESHGSRIAVTGVARGVITNDGIREWNVSWDMESLRYQLGASDSQSNHDKDKGESLLPMRTK